MHNHAESREGIKKSFRQPDSSSESDNCLSNIEIKSKNN